MRRPAELVARAIAVWAAVTAAVPLLVRVSAFATPITSAGVQGLAALRPRCG
jgi:hypothetical protein